MTYKNPKIFVVHPWETSDGSYDVAYKHGKKTYNDTGRKFRTMRAAKKHICKVGKRIGETHYLYDHPSGTKVRPVCQTKKKVVRRKKARSLGFAYTGRY